jgi:hypothetical protein
MLCLELSSEVLPGVGSDAGDGVDDGVADVPSVGVDAASVVAVLMSSAGVMAVFP